MKVTSIFSLLLIITLSSVNCVNNSNITQKTDRENVEIVNISTKMGYENDDENSISTLLLDYVKKELVQYVVPTKDDFVKNWKEVSGITNLPYYSSSDFNGDETEDYALILKSKNAKSKQELAK